MLTKLYFDLYNRMYELLHPEDGQDLAEYAIMLGIIALAVIAVIVAIGKDVSTLFTRFQTALNTNMSGS